MFESEVEQGSPETTEPSAPDTTGAQGGDAAPAHDTAPQILDLDSVDKFKFGGKEWTPGDFKNSVMFHSDYSRKTQALAEERKYYDNLSADLATVRKNPQMASEFKKHYPEKFHAYLDYVSPNQPKPDANTGKSDSPYANDPALMERLDRLESDHKERQVQLIEAEIDARFKTLSPKYPMADEEAVIARALALDSRGEKLTPKVWESIFKSVHDQGQKRAEKFYADKVEKQKTANQKGRDVAAGGGTPGTAPKAPRTIKEATAAAIDELNNS